MHISWRCLESSIRGQDNHGKHTLGVQQYAFDERLYVVRLQESRRDGDGPTVQGRDELAKHFDEKVLGNQEAGVDLHLFLAGRHQQGPDVELSLILQFNRPMITGTSKGNSPKMVVVQ